MATKIFDMGLMACEDVQAFNKTIKCESNLHDGALVVAGASAEDAFYTGATDWNVTIVGKPTKSDYKFGQLLIVDLAEVSAGNIGGNKYKIGAKLTDLELAAGDLGRARVVVPGDKFWVGDGNFATTPGTINEGDVYVPANGSILFNKVVGTPAHDERLAFAVIGAKPMTIGTTVTENSGDFEMEYLVEAFIQPAEQGE